MTVKILKIVLASYVFFSASPRRLRWKLRKSPSIRSNNCIRVLVS